MSYTLNKPATEQQLKTFIKTYNTDMRLSLAETDSEYILLEPYETLVNGTVVIDEDEKADYEELVDLNNTNNSTIESENYVNSSITLDTTVSDTFELQAGKQYNTVLTRNITLTIANVTTNKLFSQTLVHVKAPSTYNVTSFGTTYYYNGKKPDLTEDALYDLIYEWDNAGQVWTVGCVKKSSV